MSGICWGFGCDDLEVVIYHKSRSGHTTNVERDCTWRGLFVKLEFITPSDDDRAQFCYLENAVEVTDTLHAKRFSHEQTSTGTYR